MTTTIEVIKALKQTYTGSRMTAHDIGEVKAEMVLGFKCEDEIDIWYASLGLNALGLELGPPYWYAARRIIYFPELPIDAESYRELMNENR